MRLLPNQQRVNLPRRTSPRRITHLPPFRARISLIPRSLKRSRQKPLIHPRNRTFQERRFTPQIPMHEMPENHFHMKLSIPPIIHQPTLLGRIFASTIDSKEILGKDRPPLKFLSIRYISRQRNESSTLPIRIPPLPRSIRNLASTLFSRTFRPWRIRNRQIQLSIPVFSWLKDIPMTPRQRTRNFRPAFPLDISEISRSIDIMSYLRRPPRMPQSRRMKTNILPASHKRIIKLRNIRVRVIEENTQFPLPQKSRLDSQSHGVRIWVHSRFYSNFLTEDRE